MNLQEFREKYPLYKDVDDDTLARGIYDKFYADKLEFEDFSRRIGYDRLKSQGLGEAMLHSVPSGIAQGAALPLGAMEFGNRMAVKRTQDLGDSLTRVPGMTDDEYGSFLVTMNRDAEAGQYSRGVLNQAMSIAHRLRTRKLTPEEAADKIGELTGYVSQPLIGEAKRGIEAFSEEHFPISRENQQRLPVQVGSALGTTVPFIAAGAATGPVGLGLFAGLSGAGEAIENAARNGADDETTARAAALGVFPGLTDMVPVERFLGKLTAVVPPEMRARARGAAWGILKEMFAQGATEGTQEMTQQVLQNAIEQFTSQPDQALSEGVAENGLIGFLVGVLTGGAAGGVQAFRGDFRAPPPGGTGGIENRTDPNDPGPVVFGRDPIVREIPESEFPPVQGGIELGEGSRAEFDTAMEEQQARLNPPSAQGIEVTEEPGQEELTPGGGIGIDLEITPAEMEEAATEESERENLRRMTEEAEELDVDEIVIETKSSDARLKRRQYRGERGDAVPVPGEQRQTTLESLVTHDAPARSATPQATDDLLAAIGKVGGLDTDRAVAEGLDPEVIKELNRQHPGNQPFRRGGDTPEGVTRALSGIYLPDNALDTPHLLMNLIDERLRRGEWFPEGGDPEQIARIRALREIGREQGRSPRQVQAIITKALAGLEELGVGEQRVLQNALDYISDERAAVAPEVRAELERARALRRQAREEALKGATARPPADFYEDMAGDVFEEGAYDPAWDGEARALYDLHQEASEIDAAAVEAIPDSASPSDAARALWSIILRGAREQTQTAPRPAPQPAPEPAPEPVGEGEGPRGGAEEVGVPAEEEATSLEDQLGDISEEDIDNLFDKEFELASESEEERRAREAREKAAADAEAKAKADEEARIKADEERGDFELTGSTRPADQNPRQGDLVTQAAEGAATSPTNTTPEPTEGQIEAGNYKKGHVSLHGLDISIENPAGTSRREGWKPLEHHYGYIRRTEGPDGDQVDVFLGPGAETATHAYVVDQENQDGGFDEHKVMLGFDSIEAAAAGYRANYEEGWQGGASVTRMTLEEFKEWLRSGDTKARAADSGIGVTAPMRPTPEPREEVNYGSLADKAPDGTTQVVVERSTYGTWEVNTRPKVEKLFESRNKREAEKAASDIRVALLEKSPSWMRLSTVMTREIEATLPSFIERGIVRKGKGVLEVVSTDPDELHELAGALRETYNEETGIDTVDRGVRRKAFELAATLDNEADQFEIRSRPPVPKTGEHSADKEAAIEWARERFSRDEPLTKKEAWDEIGKRLGVGITSGTEASKQAEEIVEAGMVRAARRIVRYGVISRKRNVEIFRELVALYGRMPVLGARTSSSMLAQAYSTPIPLAYLADRLAGVSTTRSVYEPTAGNGALLITTTAKDVVANELDQGRAAELRAQGFDTRVKDATSYRPDGEFDVVIANPPFGAVKDEKGETIRYHPDPENPGYGTGEVDHAISLQALTVMKDGGSAVLIIGSVTPSATTETARSNAYHGKAKREFFLTLYGKYNVVDHFTVDGGLYARQGAGWPVDVIVIRGRGKSSRTLPAANVPQVFTTWESLEEKFDGVGGDQRRPDQRGQGEGRDEGAQFPGLPVPPVGPGGTAGGEDVAAGPRGGGGDVRAIGDAEPRPRPVADEPVGVRHGGVEPGVPGAPAPEVPVGQPDEGAAPEGGPGPGPDTPGVGGAGDLLDQLQDISEDELGALFDDASGTPAVLVRPPRKDPFITHRTVAGPAGRPRRDPFATPSPTETAKKELKAAGQEATMSVKDALSAIWEATGGGRPGTLHSGPFAFDEEGYQKIVGFLKSSFEHAVSAVRHVQQARIGDVLKTWMAEIAKEARAFPAEFVQNVLKPAIQKFVSQVKSGVIKIAGLSSPKKEEETEGQVSYVPASQMSGFGTLVPRNLEASTTRSLSELKDKVGNVDEFVASELQMSLAELADAFGAEQVDALALGIDNLKRGAGFIIGDQTGIGKGRVVAGMIRYAILNDKIPVFVTEKPNLYGDIYRDLKDIGMGHINPLVTNANFTLELGETAGEKKVSTGAAGAHNRSLESMAESGSLGEYDVVFTTYSQMQTIRGDTTARQRFLLDIAPNAMFIMDESHNAAGDGKPPRNNNERMTRGRYARMLVRNAWNVFYSSATWSKRPDVMDLYARTDMILAVGDPANLGPTIKAGGVPLQQVVSSMLSWAGQYIRRERSFAGVAYDAEEVGVDLGSYENFSLALRQIFAFSDFYVEAATQKLSQEIKANARQMTPDGSTGGAGANSLRFSSIMHNLIDQMLLAQKSLRAVDLAVASIERGEKPVITVANTMGSFLDKYTEDMDLRPGDAVALDFRNLLLRYLERSRQVRVKEPFQRGPGELVTLDEEYLGADGMAKFYEIRNLIENMDYSGVPISPIDYMTSELNRRGYVVGEITGRSQIIKYQGDFMVLGRRPDSIQRRRDTIRKFNAGEIDVMILNQAGATGLSLHASENFKDQRKRRMIIAQPERNIDTHMQMLGRVHRTGQVVLPSYTQMVADIPAEKRPAAALLRKMAALNANTTASAKSEMQAGTVVDFMNVYGDEVAASMMDDDHDLHLSLGLPLDYEGESLSRQEAAARVTGRIPLLPLNQQQSVYDQLESEYEAYVAQMDALGENALEAKSVPLDAKIEATMELVPAKEGVRKSPFTEAAMASRADVRRLRKPYTTEQVLTIVSEAVVGEGIPEGMDQETAAGLLDRAGRNWSADTIGRVAEEFDIYRAARLLAITSMGGENAAENIRAETTKLRHAFESWSDLMGSLYPGRTVKIQTSQGIFYGVIGGVTRSKATETAGKNPVVKSGWKVKLLFASAMREATIPMSRIVIADDLQDDNISGVAISGATHIETDLFRVPIYDAFSQLETSAREKRVIVTGNLLAGFNAVGNRGSIIYYTQQGTNQSQIGILMPADVTLEKLIESAPVEFTTADQVLRFANPMMGRGRIALADGGVIRIQSSNIFVKSARAVGGKWFLDRELLRIIGEDFAKRGENMVVTVSDRSALARAIEYMMSKGAKFYADTDKDTAKRIVEGENEVQLARVGDFSAGISTSDNPITAAWKLMSRAAHFFQYPISSSKTVAGIANDVFPGLYVSEPISDLSGATTTTFIRSPDGKEALLQRQGDEVWIDVASLTSGASRGALIYHIAANYAFNNDLVFRADPAGITDRSFYRRTENMLSSALKFQTTRHLRPHGKQGLDWRDLRTSTNQEADDVHNLQELLTKSYENVISHYPEMGDVSYNFTDGRFETEDGSPFSDRDFTRVAELGPRSGDRSAIAGRATLKRAALTGSLLRANRREPGLRRVLLGIVRQLRKGSLGQAVGVSYARGRGRGVSVSTVQGIVDKVLGRIDSARAPEVQVVETIEDLPEVARAKIEQEGADDTAGVYVPSPDGTTLYLVAGNLQDAPMARRILAHELVGHFGVEEVVEGWQDITSRLQALVDSGNTPATRVANEVARRYGDLSGDPNRWAKEMIAVAAERRAPGTLGAILARVRAAIRRWLNRVGLGGVFADPVIDEILDASGRYLSGAGARTREYRGDGVEFARAGRQPAGGRPLVEALGPNEHVDVLVGRLPDGRIGAVAAPDGPGGQWRVTRYAAASRDLSGAPAAWTASAPSRRLAHAAMEMEGLEVVPHRYTAESAREQIQQEALSLGQSIRPVVEQDRTFRELNASRLYQQAIGFIERFGVMSSLPGREDYLRMRYLTLGRISEVDRSIRVIYDTFRRATPEEAQAIFTYLTNADADPNMIPNEELRQAAIETKQTQIETGEMLVERGLLDEATFDAHRGAYLPRLYLKHLLEERDYLALSTGKKPSDMGYLKRRREIPEPVRRLILGEIKDPAFLAARSFGQQRRDIAILDWLGQVAEDERWVLPNQRVRYGSRMVTPYFLKSEARRILSQAPYLPEADRTEALHLAAELEHQADAALDEYADQVPDSFTQIPDTPRYGSLRGLYVRTEIYNDIVGAGAGGSARGAESVAERILGFGGYVTKMVQLWKWAKVAANPPAQVRNAISNIVLLHMSGVAFHRLPGTIREAYRQVLAAKIKEAVAAGRDVPAWLRARAEGVDTRHRDIGQRYGVTESTYAAVEIFRTESDFIDLQQRMTDPFSAAGVRSRAHAGFSAVHEFTGDVYQLMEEVGKVASIIDSIERKGRSEAEAALYAQRWLFDYSMVSPTVRYLRNAPVGSPFLTFHVKVLPRLAETAMRRPWVYAEYWAIQQVLLGILATLTDVDDDDIESLMEALPNWLRSKPHTVILPMRDESGRWQAVDISYFLPWSMWTEMGYQAGTGQYAELANTSLFGGPLVDAMAALRTNKDPFTGKEIVNQADPPARKLSSIVGYVWGLSMPTFLTQHGWAGKMLESIEGGVNPRTGEKRMSTYQSMMRLFGVNIYPIDPMATRRRNLRYYDYQIKDVKYRRTELLRDRNLTNEEKAEIRQEYGELIRELQNEKSKYMEESQVHPNLRAN